jgi:hypothetical protein
MKTRLLISIILLYLIHPVARCKEHIYDATAVPIIVSTIAYPYEDEMPGIIIYTAKPGTILKGATYSANGKLIKNGDVLIKYKDNRRENIYKVRQHELRNAKATLKFRGEDIKRYIRLMKGGKKIGSSYSNIVKKSTYELAISDYLKAKADVEKAEVQLIRAEGWLHLTTEHAYFDCIVTDVYIPLGLCAFEGEIMKVAQLNPMGIKIKIPKGKIYKIRENIPIKIYPFNNDEPIYTYGFSKIVSNDSIILRVKNDPVYPNIPKKYKNLPTVTDISPVKRFSIELQKTGLAVPKSSIRTDKNGHFVWKATLNNNLDIKLYKRILLLKLEKVYVTTSDEQRYITPHELYIRLSKPNKLCINDFILDKNIPPNLENFNQVIFYKMQYTFTPGDPVKVKLEI